VLREQTALSLFVKESGRRSEQRFSLASPRTPDFLRINGRDGDLVKSAAEEVDERVVYHCRMEVLELVVFLEHGHDLPEGSISHHHASPLLIQQAT
jgi:hypothetical protein